MTQTERFRQGEMPLTMRGSYVGAINGKPRQYVGLYAGKRLLGTADILEDDAKIICELFNEAVARRKSEELCLTSSGG